MAKKKTQYRKINFRASETRAIRSCSLHPELVAGLRKIARSERKTVSWLVETALSDYFGVEVMLHKFKTPPLPAQSMRDNLRLVKRA